MAIILLSSHMIHMLLVQPRTSLRRSKALGRLTQAKMKRQLALKTKFILMPFEGTHKKRRHKPNCNDQRREQEGIKAVHIEDTLKNEKESFNSSLMESRVEGRLYFFFLIFST